MREMWITLSYLCTTEKACRNKGKMDFEKKGCTQGKEKLSTNYQQNVDNLRQPDKLSTAVDNFVDKKTTDYPQGCAKK